MREDVVDLFGGPLERLMRAHLIVVEQIARIRPGIRQGVELVPSIFRSILPKTALDFHWSEAGKGPREPMFDKARD